MRVMKFGGTSVGSAARFREVARILKTFGDRDTVVVVSAMSGTTNALIRGARDAAEGREEGYLTVKRELLAKHLAAVDDLLASGPARTGLAGTIEARLQDYERLCRSIAMLGEFTMRGNDAVASIGEELSSRILASYLASLGDRAEAVSATSLVRTDDHYGGAAPDMAETRRLVTERLLPIIKDGTLPIVTGYVGATAKGVTTTLGRGGSDYTAAILGACLNADEVWIWTDVSGILTADPKLVPQATTLRELSYREAEELAYFGADVLHPKTVAPLAARGIPLRILNSFLPDDPGTLIVSEPDPGRPIMPAIISTEGLSLLALAGNGSGWSLHMASRALRCLADAYVDVLMFSQSFTERNLNLVVRGRDEAHAIHVLAAEFEKETKLGLLGDIMTRTEVATVSVVGMPNANREPIAPRAFAALGKLGLHVISVGQAASAYSVSFVIAEEDVARAVPFIHRELGL